MCSSDCCFLTCIQVSQEVGQVLGWGNFLVVQCLGLLCFHCWEPSFKSLVEEIRFWKLNCQARNKRKNKMVKLKVIEARFELIYEKKKGGGGVAVALLVCVAKPGGGRDRVGSGWGGECECSEDPRFPQFVGFLLSYSSCLTHLSQWLPVAPDTCVDNCTSRGKNRVSLSWSQFNKFQGGLWWVPFKLCPHLCSSMYSGTWLIWVPYSGSHAHLSKEGLRKSLLSRQSSQTVSMIFQKMEVIKCY